jgi:anthranilate phosphoribosyltransferase
MNTYTVLPEDVGVKRGRIEDVLARSSHVENAAVTAGVLSGSDRSTRRDLILLNAASIIYAADDVKNIRDGFEMACQAVDEGKALEELRKLITLSGGKMAKLDSILGSLKKP